MGYEMVPCFGSFGEAVTAIFGEEARAVSSKRVMGGDINDSYDVLLNGGCHVFVKRNRREGVVFFEPEAAGLHALAQTKTIGVPRVICCGMYGGGESGAFLMLEFMEQKKRAEGYWETFAHELAALHRAPSEAFTGDGKYGFFRDNYIGASPQLNTPHESWAEFFRDCRLEPQFRAAARYFDGADEKRVARLMEYLDEVLVEPEFPSLLHGDLWSGNVITGNDGRAWLIDPAVYVGCAEADLAMTELFGGFPHSFYKAYRGVMPLRPGYEERRDIYNLYHLLNHLNLFGVAYLSAVRRVLGAYS